MKAVVGAIVLEVVVVRQLVRYFSIQQNARLKRPAPRHVAHRVPSSSQDQEGDIFALYVLHARRVASKRQVETAEPVARQRVSAALEHDCLGCKTLKNFVDDGAKNAHKGIVVHAVVEGEIYSVAFALAVPDVLDVPRARKVLSKLVERARHHAVGRVESLLDTIAVVNVDVDVENALMVLEQLEDCEDAVVNVAKSARFRLFGVVESSRPVDDNIALVAIESLCAPYRARRVDLAKLKEAIKYRAVLSDVEALKLAHVLVHVIRRHESQKVHIVISMKLGHSRLVD